MANPYEAFPSKAFWRTAVADNSPREIAELWEPKHPLQRTHKVATFGSCFAQHFGRALAARDYAWFDAEPAPGKANPAFNAKYNYGVFSARTSNIYTVAALRQWVSWALGAAKPPDEIWESDGHFCDPFRPSIEPGGFASVKELVTSRGATLRAIARIVDEADWFVFTLGLTEGWINRAQGYNYAMCPGTIAGEFAAEAHAFKNYSFQEIEDDLNAVIDMLLERNRDLRVLLTVSPVPLTATASGKHILTATTYSKSVLRAVAGAVADSRESVDYFPSYEIIASAPFQGMFYEDNKRSVTQQGVDFVMDSFFAGLRARFGEAPAAPRSTPSEDAASPANAEGALVCEEQMLAAFQR